MSRLLRSDVDKLSSRQLRERSVYFFRSNERASAFSVRGFRVWKDWHIGWADAFCKNEQGNIIVTPDAETRFSCWRYYGLFRFVVERDSSAG